MCRSPAHKKGSSGSIREVFFYRREKTDIFYSFPHCFSAVEKNKTTVENGRKISRREKKRKKFSTDGRKERKQAVFRRKTTESHLTKRQKNAMITVWKTKRS
ncbi:MAG TPA: hypothetical protein DCE65_02480 [Clostridiales bacterium]|nr:hypothetical protein [Clostridiales bacterium]